MALARALASPTGTKVPYLPSTRISRGPLVPALFDIKLNRQALKKGDDSLDARRSTLFSDGLVVHVHYLTSISTILKLNWYKTIFGNNRLNLI